jgi:hypothetical protein
MDGIHRIHRRDSEQRGIHRETSMTTDAVDSVEKHDQNENEKISVYRVEKKKLQHLQPKFQ